MRHRHPVSAWTGEARLWKAGRHRAHTQPPTLVRLLLNLQDKVSVRPKPWPLEGPSRQGAQDFSGTEHTLKRRKFLSLSTMSQRIFLSDRRSSASTRFAISQETLPRG